MAKGCLSELESAAQSVTQVYWPEDVGPLWRGTYGTAKVFRGEPMAVLSGGTKFSLEVEPQGIRWRPLA